MNPLLEAYIENHIDKEPLHLRRLEKATNLQRVNGRMCSGHIQGRLLRMLTRMAAPARALEFGTFTGYSALCIAEGLPPGGSLVTIEIEDELEEPVLAAFEEGGYMPDDSGSHVCTGPGGRTIELRIGDAMEIAAGYPDGSFGLIFIDADKRQYPAYYREAKRLLAPGGFILADNTLWDSHVVEEGRHDPQTEGIRAFNSLAASDPEMEVVIVPLRDGLSILHKPKDAPARY